MTFHRASLTMMLALLVLVTSVLAATPPRKSLPNTPSPSSKGSTSANPEGLVDIGLCTIQCGAQCIGGKAFASPDKFRFGKIIGGLKKLPWVKAICMASCMMDCTINQGNVKPELYHCTLGCVHQRNNYSSSCYNKCEENYQG